MTAKKLFYILSAKSSVFDKTVNAAQNKSDAPLSAACDYSTFDKNSTVLGFLGFAKNSAGVFSSMIIP